MRYRGAQGFTPFPYADKCQIDDPGSGTEFISRRITGLLLRFPDCRTRSAAASKTGADAANMLELKTIMKIVLTDGIVTSVRM